MTQLVPLHWGHCKNFKGGDFAYVMYIKSLIFTFEGTNAREILLHMQVNYNSIQISLLKFIYLHI